MCSNKSWAFLYRSGERLGGGQGQSGGLTALGRAALDEIIRLGMVVDHVGVATDARMDGPWTNDEVSGDGVLDGRDPWRAVVTRLWQMGYSTADLEKIMGLNLLRVYQRVLK